MRHGNTGQLRRSLLMPGFEGYPLASAISDDDLFVTLDDPAVAKTTKRVPASVLRSYINTTSGADPTLGGDLTGTASNAQLAAGVVVDADVNASAAIALSKLANSTKIVLLDAAPTASEDGTAPVYSDALGTHESVPVVESPVPIADGGTGATSASAALSNLNAQPLDTDLTAISLLTTAAFGRGLLTLADAAALAAALPTDPYARANHTGTQLASTVSNFDTQVRTSRLDQMAAPSGVVSFATQRITNVADPIGAQDAATKNYADGIAAGLKTKAPVLAATTVNITLSGTQTVDGVALGAGDRVLVKNQTTGASNGLYLVATGAWSRTTDADISAEVTSGLFVYVNSGTVNGGKGFVLTTNDPITLGTTALVFSQFSGGVADPNMGGDLTGTASAAQIAAGAIVNADINASAAIALSKLAVDPLARANHTGTQLAATVSDFASASRAVTIVRNRQTGATYTLALSDAGGLVERDNGAANTLTIPTNAAVAFPIDTMIAVLQYGSGTTTINGPGVTLLSRDGALVMAGTYAWATLYKRGTNEWIVQGDVVP